MISRTMLVTTNTPIDNSVFVDDPLAAVKAAAPLWYFDSKTCFPSTATQANGSQAPIIENDYCANEKGTLRDGCPVQEAQTQKEQLSTSLPTDYTIRKCSESSWRIVYVVFFLKVRFPWPEMNAIAS